MTQPAESDPIKSVLQTMRHANDLARQRAVLPSALAPLLQHAIPRLDDSPSVTFISSDLWHGNQDSSLSSMVKNKCFHADPQARRIIGIVQAYGCGKTKTGLRLAHSFILLPIRFNASTHLASNLIRAQQHLLEQLAPSPAYQDLEHFRDKCLRLVELCLFSLIALYDHALSTHAIDSSSADRFRFAVLLLNDTKPLVGWCQDYFEAHKESVQKQASFNTLRSSVMNVRREAPIVFLFDEVQVLFNQCRGFCLHKVNTPPSDTAAAVTAWIQEQKDGKVTPTHKQCTDLFYQLRVVMLDYLLGAGGSSGAACGFVMCSTMFRIWSALEEENSPLSRGTIEEFFQLHWFTHADIKATVNSMFKLPAGWADGLERASDDSRMPPHQRLSAFCRPLFLMEFMEQLCEAFPRLSDGADSTLLKWLRETLQNAEKSAMKRAKQQLHQLVNHNAAVDTFTTRQLVYLLYTTQRLCGSTLELKSEDDKDNSMLGNIISKGVARLSVTNKRFRISDPIFAEALLQSCPSPLADHHQAVIKTLKQHMSLHQALVAHDHSHKGYLMERVLAWLMLSSKLSVRNFNKDGSSSSWLVAAPPGHVAGTMSELERGELTAQEPALMQCILTGKDSYVLLPTTLAGPDLWLRAHVNGKPAALVAVQSKMENVVYTMAKFRAALQSLDPVRMYHSADTARANWQACVPDVRTQPVFHRIVFSARGFTGVVQYYVREYNLARGGRQFIHLLHLDDIKDATGSLDSVFRREIPDAVKPTRAANAFFYASFLRSKSQSTWSQRLKMDELKVHCMYRNITMSKNNKPKSKTQLLTELMSAASTNAMARVLKSLDSFQPLQQTKQKTKRKQINGDDSDGSGVSSEDDDDSHHKDSAKKAKR